MEADVSNDVVTALRSDLAGLQYKRDKLISEVRLTNTCIIYFCLYLLIFHAEANITFETITL